MLLIPRLGHDLEDRILLQERADALAHEVVIIDDDEANHQTGISTTTCVPMPGSLARRASQGPPRGLPDRRRRPPGAQSAPLTGSLTTPLSRELDHRESSIRAGRSRLRGGLRGRQLDDAGVFQGVLDACCGGPRDANWC